MSGNPSKMMKIVNIHEENLQEIYQERCELRY